MFVKNTNNSDLTEVRRGQTGTGLLIENDGHIIANPNLIGEIKENIDTNSKFICPDHFVVSAIFQKYGIKNANNRIYPENVLRREVDKYIKERVANRCALGSLDHPAASVLSGHDISHNILDLRWEGQTLVGELELQLSPGYKRYGVCSTSGDLAANMLLNNYLIGVSSRGIGSVKQVPGGIFLVEDDFEIICWDIVIDPSTPGAYMKNKVTDLSPFMENKKTPVCNVNEKVDKLCKLLLI